MTVTAKQDSRPHLEAAFDRGSTGPTCLEVTALIKQLHCNIAFIAVEGTLKRPIDQCHGLKKRRVAIPVLIRFEVRLPADVRIQRISRIAESLVGLSERAAGAHNLAACVDADAVGKTKVFLRAPPPKRELRVQREYLA